MTHEILKLWEADAKEITLAPYDYDARILALIQALRKAEEGLKYYADEKMWESYGGDDFYVPNSFECEKNEYGFEKAQETLAEIEGILNHA